MLILNNHIVFKSNSTSGEFTIEQDGQYVIKFTNIGINLFDGNFSYVIEKQCVYIKDFINDWLQSDYLDQRDINMILVGGPTNFLQGHEYLTFQRNATNILFKKFQLIELFGSQSAMLNYSATLLLCGSCTKWRSLGIIDGTSLPFLSLN